MHRGLPARYGLYLAERFPVLGHGLLILSFYSSNQFLAHALTQPGQTMRYDSSTLMGYATIFLLFLHLRIFDDHKDYHADCRSFPERVLQRGVVTLGELKGLAGLAILAQIVLASVRGLPALIAAGVAITFSVLMLKEFFIGGWLRRHFLVYAGTHMLIMPLLALVVFSFATDRYPWEASGWFWLYAFVGFFVAFNWEISRKIRAPEDERPGVDTYTKVFGTYGAAYAVLGVRVLDTLLVSLVGWHLGLSRWFYVWLIALFLVCLIGFLQFRLQTGSQTARRMELYAGLYIFAFDIALAVELGRTYGIDFAWSSH